MNVRQAMGRPPKNRRVDIVTVAAILSIVTALGGLALSWYQAIIIREHLETSSHNIPTKDEMP